MTAIIPPKSPATTSWLDESILDFRKQIYNILHVSLRMQWCNTKALSKQWIEKVCGKVNEKVVWEPGPWFRNPLQGFLRSRRLYIGPGESAKSIEMVPHPAWPTCILSERVGVGAENTATSQQPGLPGLYVVCCDYLSTRALEKFFPWVFKCPGSNRTQPDRQCDCLRKFEFDPTVRIPETGVARSDVGPLLCRRIRTVATARSHRLATNGTDSTLRSGISAPVMVAGSFQVLDNEQPSII